jgi:hypothetical protein
MLDHESLKTASSAYLDELCKFTFDGKQTLPSSNYGPSYMTEYRDILLGLKGKTIRALEWGTGHTTILTAEYLKSIPGHLLVGVDDYGPFAEMLSKHVNPSCNFHSFLCSRVGETRNQVDPELNYSSFPVSYGQVFDFVFIDGRRRMECALHALLLARSDATIVIHDFRRARYQAILCIFDLVDETSQFRVVRPNPTIQGAALERFNKHRLQFTKDKSGETIKPIRLGVLNRS